MEEPGRSIERVQKLGAKPYDGSGDPEAAWLWLDRVNKVYGVMGCTDEQRVLFSNFLMEDMAKEGWDAVERRYPNGVTWDHFLTRPDPDTLPIFPGWSRLVKSHCIIPREDTVGPHLKEGSNTLY